MADHRQSGTGTTLRWSARALGVLIAGFFLFMFIGESLGSPGDLARIRPIEALQLGLWGVYIVGVLLALRWEYPGALVALGGVGGFFLLHGFRGGLHAMLNPLFLAMWLPLVLYWLCWTVEGGPPRSHGASPQAPPA